MKERDDDMAEEKKEDKIYRKKRWEEDNPEQE